MAQALERANPARSKFGLLLRGGSCACRCRLGFGWRRFADRFLGPAFCRRLVLKPPAACAAIPLLFLPALVLGRHVSSFLSECAFIRANLRLTPETATPRISPGRAGDSPRPRRCACFRPGCRSRRRWHDSRCARPTPLCRALPDTPPAAHRESFSAGRSGWPQRARPAPPAMAGPAARPDRARAPSAPQFAAPDNAPSLSFSGCRGYSRNLPRSPCSGTTLRRTPCSAQSAPQPPAPPAPAGSPSAGGSIRRNRYCFPGADEQFEASPPARQAATPRRTAPPWFGFPRPESWCAQLVLASVAPYWRPSPTPARFHVTPEAGDAGHAACLPLGAQTWRANRNLLWLPPAR